MCRWGFRAATAAVFVALCTAPQALAAEGDVDPSFSRDGNAVIGKKGGNAVSTLADGSVVVATLTSVTRLTEDGTNDVAFRERSTEAIAALGGRPIVSDVLGSGDRTYVAVGTREADPVTAATLIRLGPDGAPDPSFSPFTIPITARYLGARVALGPRGIVFGASNVIARLDESGTPDATFSGDGRAELPSEVQAVAVKSDGSVVVADLSGLNQLTPAGVPDPDFPAVPAGFYGPNGVVVDAQDNTFFTGAGYSALYPGCVGYVRKIAPDGRGLPSGLDRTGCPSPANLVVDAQGRPSLAYTGGAFENPDFLLIYRATASGQADASFGIAGSVKLYPKACTSSAYAATLDTEGRLVVTARVCGKVGVLRFLASSEGADRDGDGVGDGRDRCDLRSAKKHRGCPTVESRMIVSDITDGQILGRIESDDTPFRRPGSRIPPPVVYPPPCDFGRRVVALLPRPGKDRVVARSRSNYDGNWILEGVPVGEGKVRLEVAGKYSAAGYCEPDQLRRTPE